MSVWTICLNAQITPKPGIKKILPKFGRIFFGGAEGSRTPVRKQFHRTFYGCRRSFTFPSSSVGRHTQEVSRVMMRGTVNSFRTHGRHSFHAPDGSWPFRLQGRPLIKQRRELRCRCSLIYNCPFYGGWAPPPAYPASSSPSKPVRPRRPGSYLPGK